MISGKDILQVGRTQKPYGIRGEIVVLFHKKLYADLETDYYFLEIEGIPVPFHVEEFIYTSDLSARVKLADIEDETIASRYVNLFVYLPGEVVEQTISRDESHWEQFIGYTIMDQHGDILGVIEEVDDATLNVLFIVFKDEKEMLIPATDDFIAAIDEDKRVIEMYLPEGLTDE